MYVAINVLPVHINHEVSNLLNYQNTAINRGNRITKYRGNCLMIYSGCTVLINVITKFRVRIDRGWAGMEPLRSRVG